uniref:Si:dkey-81h8.1 n=1 Tax=Sphaeramia orbicularis TaxID=375764 RepID=A0A672ZBW1_9TELE
MAPNDKDPVPPVGTLSPGQLQSLLKMEPKTLGAIQIVIGALILCLSASVLQIHEVHFTGDVALFLIVVTLSGSVLVHTGRRPTLFWVSMFLNKTKVLCDSSVLCDVNIMESLIINEKLPRDYSCCV